MLRKILLLLLCLQVSTFSIAQLSRDNRNLLRKELAKKVNNLRKSKGLKPLAFNTILQKAAQNQSNYLAKENKLSHSQPNPKLATPAIRVLKFGGIDLDAIGENVLYASAQKFPLTKSAVYKLAKDMFESWKKSPGHYANMVNPEYELGDFGFKIGNKKKVVFATQVFGKKGIRVPSQLSNNSFGLKAAPPSCAHQFEQYANLIANMGNALMIEGDQVVFYHHDINYFNKIFVNADDGIAVDLIIKDQVACEHPNQLDKSLVYDGVLLKPVFRKEILDNNQAESEYRVIASVGTIPRSLLGKEISPALILIKGGKKCQYLVPGIVPNKAYSLRPIEPLLYNPLGIELQHKGIISTQHLVYDFQTNIVEPILIPEIKKESHEIHSIEIASYSSIEGSTEKNALLHKQRAQTIKQHILKNIKTNPSKVQIDAKENWEKMNFQLKYFFADSLLNWSPDSLKDLIASGDQSLPWDSLLFEQRRATARINYLGTLADSTDIRQLAPLNLKMAILREDFDLANKAMFEMYKASFFSPDVLFEEMVFEAIKKHPELVQNAAALLTDKKGGDLHKTTVFLDSWMHRKEDLSEAASRNLIHLYTLTGENLLFVWDLPAKRLSNVIHPSRVTKMIDENIENELVLNLHLTFIKYFGQINDGANITKSFNYISEYFKSTALKTKDEVDLALFFNRWSMFLLTIDLLLPKFEEEEYNEDAVFTLVQTLSFYDSGIEEEVFESVYTKALELNQGRWCKWINENIQILRDHKIKSLYCDHCSEL